MNILIYNRYFYKKKLESHTPQVMSILTTSFSDINVANFGRKLKYQVL